MDNDEYWLHKAFDEWLDMNAKNRAKEEQCECGTRTTLGKDDSAELHSDYCPVYKRWKKEKEK